MKTGKLHIWAPELIVREGGIQTYSIDLVEAAVEILGPGRITVISPRLSVFGRMAVLSVGRWVNFLLGFAPPLLVPFCCGRACWRSRI